MAVDSLPAKREEELTEGSATHLWQQALRRLQSRVTPPNFDTWLKDTRGLCLQRHPPPGSGLTLVVGARSDFATEWLSTRLRPTIAHILATLDTRIADVAFEVFGAPVSHAASPSRATDRCGPAAEAPPPSEDRPVPEESAALDSAAALWDWPRPRLNSRFTFDSFVVGSSNRLAHGACMAAASSPGSLYNPLLVLGENGLGKTHLLHAIAHETTRAGLRVACVLAEQFTNDYTTASRQRRWDRFRWRYRAADMLIIDDVQFLEGKEQTIKEFCHTLDELHSSGRQVVLSAERHPAQIPGLSPLAARLHGGLAADLQRPPLPLRISILHAKAAMMSVHLPDEVLEFLANHPSLKNANVCDLEGSLLRVAAHARVSSQPLTLELAAEAMLGGEHGPPPATSPPPDAIITAVCDHFHLTQQLLASKSRDSHLAFARQVAMYLLRQEARCTLAEIGRLLGNRDHSTVIHGCTKIARELTLLPDTRQHVDSVQRSLRQFVA